MADLDDIKDGKDFRTDQPRQNIPFTLKGCGALDWGMQSRLSRIFNPKTGKTVMLAFDHGYFQGPTTGLERIDINIAPLFEHADVLMCTRGILRSVVPPATNKPVVLRASGANSILAELSNEAVALSMDDAVRLNSCAVAAQVYIGSEYEHQSIKNIIQLVDAGMKVGMPTMAVTGVGKDMVRDQRYFSLATRIAAEMGAQIIKTYYVEKGFERIVAGCPVPIVIAGGKKLPEREALEMCWQAIDQGASGVDMGRNIFQSDHPVAMMKAVQAVVHHNETADRAYELDLIFANASLQWLPDHYELFPHLVSLLNPQGVLAVQMPDNWLEPTHVLMREVAWEQNYPDRGREPLAGVHAYYDILSEAGCEVDIWRTTYYHQMPSHQAIIDWVTATGLRPWLQDLTESEQQLFLKRYHQMLEEQYPLQENGQILLAFPRLFIVARRME